MNKVVIVLVLMLLMGFLLISGCSSEECIEVLDDETKMYKQYCEDDDDYHYHRSYSPYRSVRKSSSMFKSGGPGIRGK